MSEKIDPSIFGKKWPGKNCEVCTGQCNVCGCVISCRSPAPATATEEMEISTANYLYLCEKCTAEIKTEDAHAVKHNGIRFLHYCLGCLTPTP